MEANPAKVSYKGDDMDTEDWKLFEAECAAYLSARYAGTGIEVTEFGGPDSTMPDVVVRGRVAIAVETKMARAQSGQFVVGYDDGDDEDDRFFLAESCSGALSKANTAVIDALNSDTEHYLDEMATQGWTRIDANERDIEQCITEHYLRTKDEEYLMTGYLGGGKMLVRMTDLGKYFTTTAKMRYKRSGPRPVAAYDSENVGELLVEHQSYLRETGKYPGVEIGKLYKDGRHWHTEIGVDLPKHDRYFGDEAYYLSPCRGKAGLYRAKRRACTKSITVLFALDLHGDKFVDGQGFSMIDRDLGV